MLRNQNVKNRRVKSGVESSGLTCHTDITDILKDDFPSHLYQPIKTIKT